MPAFPKERPVRSEPYRRLVASMRCWRCDIGGFSNAAHADAGKGGGIKSSDLTCFPLCVDRPGVRGCHSIFGASGKYTKESRRALELEAAKETQEAIIELSQDDPKIRKVLVKVGLVK
jgi:hypothetical protein